MRCRARRVALARSMDDAWLSLCRRPHFSRGGCWSSRRANLLGVIHAALLVYLTYKFARRQRFPSHLRKARITPNELKRLVLVRACHRYKNVHPLKGGLDGWLQPDSPLSGWGKSKSEVNACLRSECYRDGSAIGGPTATPGMLRRDRPRIAGCPPAPRRAVSMKPWPLKRRRKR